MKKYLRIIVLTGSLLSSVVYAQNVGINTTGAAPNTSAGLDIDFSNKGLLIPRINLASSTDAVTIPTPATGLLIFNTNTALSGGSGFYYNSGTPASPLWVVFKKQQEIYYVPATGSATVTNGAPGPTAIPGLTKTITIPTGFTADIQIYATIGGSNTVTNTSAYTLIDFILFDNGVTLAGGGTGQGGYERFSIINYSSTGGGNGFNTSSMVAMELARPAGTYTYVIGVYRDAASANTIGATLGGSCLSITDCGEMTIVVNYK